MKEIITEKIIYILSSFFYASLFLMATEFNKKLGIFSFLTVILPIILFFFTSSKKNFKFSIKIEPFHCHLLFLGLYCCLSGYWAFYDTNSSIQIGFKIFKILIYLSVFWLSFYRERSILPTLKVIMTGGFIVCLCFLLYEGVGGIIAYMNGTIRMTNDFMNANKIGMLSTMSILINIFFVVAYNDEKKMLPLSVFALLVVFISCSRKALVSLCFGIVAIFFCYIFKNIKITFYSIIKNILCPLLICIFVLILLNNTPIFAVMSRRMNGLIALLSGEGHVDSSARTRFALNRLGFDIFCDNPILGLGVDNSKYLVEKHFGYFYYLHNNYVELLACGGIIGFLIFYSYYFYVLFKLFKYRKYSTNDFYFYIILLSNRFILDYGCVTFESAETYFYFILPCILIKSMKDKKLRLAGKNSE